MVPQDTQIDDVVFMAPFAIILRTGIKAQDVIKGPEERNLKPFGRLSKVFLLFPGASALSLLTIFKPEDRVNVHTDTARWKQEH